MPSDGGSRAHDNNWRPENGEHVNHKIAPELAKQPFFAKPEYKRNLMSVPCPWQYVIFSQNGKHSKDRPSNSRRT
jgi:hypothetical protein